LLAGLRAIWLICLIPVFFALAAAVMLIERDITAPSWARVIIQDRASAALDGGRLRIGAITLRISRDLRPSVRLRDTRVIDGNGITLTRVPAIDLTLSPRGVVFQRDILVQTIRVTGAQIDLSRARDGSFSFAFGAGQMGQARNLADLLEQMDRFFESAPLNALRLVDAEGLIVNYNDARAGRSWTVDGGQLALDLRGRQVRLNADLALLSGGADVSTATLSYSSPRGSLASQLAIRISDIPATDIAAQSPALSWLAEVQAPLTASLRMGLDEAGALTPLFAVLDIGAGVIQPTPAAEPLRFSAARTYLRYDPAQNQLVFTDIALSSEWGGLRASGEAYLRDLENGLPRTLVAQFRLRDLAIDPPGLFDDAPVFDSVSLDLRLRRDPFRIDLGQVVVDDGASRISLNGQIAATDAGWQARIDSHIDQITPARLRALWPNGFRPGTRDWFDGHVHGGDLSDLRFGLRLIPGQPLDLAGHFTFAGADVTAMRTLPRVTDAYGTGSLVDHRFVVAVDQGVMQAETGGQVTMDGTAFVIEDLRQRPSPATLALQSDSSLPALLSLINQPPFSYLDKANLPVTLADGQAQAQGRITWPLQPAAPREAIRFDLGVDLAAVRSDRLVPGRVLKADQMQVAVNDDGLRISGPVTLDDIPADASWFQGFTPASAGQSRLQAEVDLTPAGLRAFNIGLPAGMVTGAGRGLLQVDLIRGQEPRFVLTSDLRGLSLAVPALGWAKAPGTTGSLRIEGRLGPVPEIGSITLDAAGLQATGRVVLNGQGGLDRAVFNRVRLDGWLDAPVTIRGQGQGRPVAIDVTGGRVDLRRAQLGAGGGTGGQGGGPVNLALDELTVTETIRLTGFRGDFTTLAGFTGQFSAAINGMAAVTGTIAPRDGRSAVRLRGADAGAILQAAGVLTGGLGGSFDLTLLPAPQPSSFDGSLAINGLRVRDAPTIAALLDAVSVVGLVQQMRGQGLVFDNVDASFRLTPDQIILTEASAVGPGLGISLDGIYMLASNEMDLQGVVSPFYLINAIGAPLTRRGEGLVGMAFTLTGPARAPRVGVNPLSVLTPGMFRDIFRRPPPELTQ
jgi:hypothetical protein